MTATVVNGSVGLPPARAVAVVAAGAVTSFVAIGEPLAVLAVVLLVGGLLVLRRPELAALAAVALVASNALVLATGRHGFPAVLSMAIPLLLLIAIAHRLFEHRSIVVPPATPWLLALIAVLAAGTIASRDPGSALAGLTVWLVEGLVLWLLVVNAVRGAGAVRAAAIVLVTVLGLLALASLARAATGSDDDLLGFAQVSDAVVGRDAGEGSARHAGPVGEQNRWAQNLAMTLPVAVALALGDRSRPVRAVATVAGAAMLGGIALTYSRGAAVGLLLTSLVALAASWVPRRWGMAGLAVVVLAVVVANPTFASRTATVVTAPSSWSGPTSRPGVLDEGSADGSFVNRAAEGRAALSVFRQHPVVGVGPDQFATYYQDEARSAGVERIVGVDRQAHNLLLGLAAEAGVLGVVAFGGVIAATMRSLLAARRRLVRLGRPDLAALATGFAGAVVAYLATGLFLHLSYIRFLWLLLALAAATALVGDEEPVGDPTGPDPADRVTEPA